MFPNVRTFTTVEVSVVLKWWLDLMQALTFVGILQVSILTILFNALVVPPVLLTCLTT